MSEISETVLQRAITGTSDLSSASLATKILVSRLRREAAKDPGTLPAKIKELRDFFTAHAFATNDLAIL